MKMKSEPKKGLMKWSLLLLATAAIDIFIYFILKAAYIEGTIPHNDFHTFSGIVVKIAESIIIACTCGIFYCKFILKRWNIMPILLAVSIMYIFISSTVLLFTILLYVLHLIGYEEFLSLFIIIEVFSVIFVTIFLIKYYSDTIRISYLRKTRSENLAVKKENQRLKAELMAGNLMADNHFLYNCLGMLYVRIDEDQANSKYILEQILDISRYISTKVREEKTDIRSELEFTDKYFYLTKERFPLCELHISDELRFEQGYVIPLSLQTLVENAIKHNSHAGPEHLCITIRKVGDMIEVRNNILPLLSGYHSTGTGLMLLKSRYSEVSDKPVIINNDKGCFSVLVPIL